ncbi:hypothetical protein KMW28_10540 [Flammeovirga yaeyamensis]|uniref:DUF7832 domain-containing protein n=1 Tax=Flammeovirga yaeyamensis TaxID=367791 RepID=A0AAX1N2M2_9BACT|nr:MULTISPECIES: hypothetical protein [Flammeovirga]ANQ48513.1 hypothetical protein MY04_1136 [Flammeovirga sp. MY04]MBB3696407.1 hypothetical protein [Flammeovirga yaeyamensis]NMF35086.1 hypothetical protein [Flammeovirga yaeyamensis]QWG00093.1 hypothetical protein KMW28_10540 [Flammeovirga yaeyamensis]
MNSTNTTVIDNVRNYFGNDYPEDLSLDQAYLHIGHFFGWVIANDLYSEEYEDDFGSQILYFSRKEITPIILAETLDGILDIDLFDDDIKPFVLEYYCSGQYLNDYKDALLKELESMFHIQDTWDNFSIMSKLLNQRYDMWKNKS